MVSACCGPSAPSAAGKESLFIELLSAAEATSSCEGAVRIGGGGRAPSPDLEAPSAAMALLAAAVLGSAGSDEAEGSVATEGDGEGERVEAPDDADTGFLVEKGGSDTGEGARGSIVVALMVSKKGLGCSE